MRQAAQPLALWIVTQAAQLLARQIIGRATADRGALCWPSVTLSALFALALLGWAPLRATAGYGRRDPALRQLSAREYALVRCAAEAAFPPGGPIPLSGIDARIPEHIDRYLAALPARNRVLIRLLFVLIEHATLLFKAPGWDGWRRFSALSLEQRIAVLEGWARSKIQVRRLVFQGLRAVLTMGYFACPAVLRAIGLAPLAIETPVVDADLLYPPIGKPRSAIRFGVEDRARTVARLPLDPHGPLQPGFGETSA